MWVQLPPSAPKLIEARGKFSVLLSCMSLFS
jgi:hypothetical protein